MAPLRLDAQATNCLRLLWERQVLGRVAPSRSTYEVSKCTAQNLVRGGYVRAAGEDARHRTVRTGSGRDRRRPRRAPALPVPGGRRGPGHPADPERLQQLRERCRQWRKCVATKVLGISPVLADHTVESMGLEPTTPCSQMCLARTPADARGLVRGTSARRRTPRNDVGWCINGVPHPHGAMNFKGGGSQSR